MQVKAKRGPKRKIPSASANSSSITDVNEEVIHVEAKLKSIHVYWLNSSVSAADMFCSSDIGKVISKYVSNNVEIMSLDFLPRDHDKCLEEIKSHMEEKNLI
jgi:hypothetical protein